MTSKNTDTERLDWLESHGNGLPWIARESTLGRGYRLHNKHPNDPAFRGHVRDTVREAIDAAMAAEQSEQKQQ